jgi:hypothetical protein
MNKKLIAVMLLPAFSVLAAEDLDPAKMAKIAKKREEWTRQHFAKQGSPFPGGGVVVLPEQQMSEYKTFKAQRDKEHEEIKKYGYIKQFSPQTQSLLNFKEISRNQFAAKSSNPANEGLHHHINEIEMAYDFKGVPADAVTTMIGVAPSVTYIKGQGWAGAMQFFEKEGLGNCSYRENNLKLSRGSAILPQEDVTYEVNNKITIHLIAGKLNSGFMYSVDWYDENFFHELKCANEQYSEKLMNNAIELARQIDAN